MANKEKITRKIFVLDTNVLLHDYKCIYNFDEHDIVIPITVLEELDRFKKGNDIINFHAREFTRELDKLSGDKLFNGGLSLGKEKGKLSIETGKPYSEQLQASFPENTPDHRILAIAEHLYLHQNGAPVILITKDINLRMKAKSLGIMAQDYHNDMVQNIEDIYEGVQVSEDIDPDAISRLYEDYGGLPSQEFGIKSAPSAHQYFIFRNESISALAHFDPFNKVINRVEKTKTYGIEPRNAEQTFALDALMRPEVQLVALTGKAGTGKTLLALASGLRKVLGERVYARVLIARPIIPMGKDIGYLPGAKDEKMSHWMQPLFDNLEYILSVQEQQGFKSVEQMMSSKVIEIEALTYIRGRSLPKQYIIIDEAQNLSPHEVKTIVSRAGEGTKVILTGDPYQIDSPYLDADSNGLTYLVEMLKGDPLFGHITLDKSERSPLAELAAEKL